MLFHVRNSASSFNRRLQNLLRPTPFLLATTRLDAKPDLAQPTQQALLRVDGDNTLINAIVTAMIEATALYTTLRAA